MRRNPEVQIVSLVEKSTRRLATQVTQQGMVQNLLVLLDKRLQDAYVTRRVRQPAEVR